MGDRQMDVNVEGTFCDLGNAPKNFRFQFAILRNVTDTKRVVSLRVNWNVENW